MQCFPSIPNALAAGSPYIFQYPTAHGLAQQASDLATQLNTFHQSQTQLPNSSTLISPASQYSSTFQPNLNIAFIPGQTTPFLSATQQLAAAAQTPMFIGNPLNSFGNAFPTVQNFGVTVDPSTIGVLGSAVNIIKDSPDLIVVSNSNLATTNVVTNLVATNLVTTDLPTTTTLITTTPVKQTKEAKTSSVTTNNKDQICKKSSKETSSVNRKLEKTKNLLKNKPISLTLNHSPVNLNNLTNNSNTTTTSTIQTKSAIIKIKPSQSLSTTTTTDNGASKTIPSKIDSPSSKVVKSKSLNSNANHKDVKQQKQNGNLTTKTKSLATGIRKDREKKVVITTNQMNNGLNRKLVNNLNTSKSTQPKLITNDHQIGSSQQQKSFLPPPAPEPIIANQFNLVGLNSSNLVLLNSTKSNVQQQQQQPAKTLTIVLSKKDATPPKATNNKQTVTTNLKTNKTAIIIKRPNDLKSPTATSTSSPLNTQPLTNNNNKSNRNSITITPIAMNTNSTTNSTITKEASLTTVQLDTASMRTATTKKSASTNMNNNMFNQTGKCLTIHPSNFYSNGAVGISSTTTTTTTTKKLTPTDLRTNNQLINSNSSSKVNDVNLNLDYSPNESPMKGFNKKTTKSNQLKQNEKKTDHELQISHGWNFVGSPTKKTVMISVGISDR